MKKKTNIMRVAVAMLALTMITSCFVGGTFAKYTTSESASQSARVAKFGVNVMASGDLFGTTYKNVENGNADGTGAGAAILSVKSSNGDTIVAPGTKNDKGLKIGITGKPEVAVKLDIQVGQYLFWENVRVGIVMDPNATQNPLYITFVNNLTPFDEVEKDLIVTLQDYYELEVDLLCSSGYPKETAESYMKEFIARNYGITDPAQYSSVSFGASDIYVGEYYPVKYTLTQTPESGEAKILVDGGKLADVSDALTSAVKAAGYEDLIIPANTDLGEIFGQYTLTWEWPFESDHDKEDTFLGSLVDGEVSVPVDDFEAIGGTVEQGGEYYEPSADIDYSLYASIILNITVTQVD